LHSLELLRCRRYWRGSSFLLILVTVVTQKERTAADLGNHLGKWFLAFSTNGLGWSNGGEDSWARWDCNGCIIDRALLEIVRREVWPYQV